MLTACHSIPGWLALARRHFTGTRGLRAQAQHAAMRPLTTAEAVGKRQLLLQLQERHDV